MKKVKQFDRVTCGYVSDYLSPIIEKEAKKLGLTFKRGHGTYGDGTFSFKVTLTTGDENGNSQTVEAKNYLKYCEYMGMKKEFLMQEFDSGGSCFRLEGYKPKASKLPYLCRNMTTNQLYKLPRTRVMRALGVKNEVIAIHGD